MIENWIELFIGAVVLISPWIFGFANISLARWVNMICGLVLVLIGIWAIYGKGIAGDMAEDEAPQNGNRKQRSKSREKSNASQ